MHPNRQQAIEQGKPRFEGVACRICGGTLRYVINCDCVKCSCRRSKLFRQRTQAKVRHGKVREEAASQ